MPLPPPSTTSMKIILWKVSRMMRHDSALEPRNSDWYICLQNWFPGYREYGWPPEDQGQTSVNLDITCPQKLHTSTNHPPGQPPLAPLFLFSFGVFHSPKCSEAGSGHRDTGGERHENRLQFLARERKVASYSPARSFTVGSWTGKEQQVSPSVCKSCTWQKAARQTQA